MPGAQALDMAVHGLPSVLPLAQDEQRTRWGRLKMTVIMLVCAAPVIASYLTYYVVRPEARRHFGELIEPQRPLPDAGVADLDGASANLRSLKGQWLLLSVAPASCDRPCQDHLYLQRQLRESLGKDKERVDWVWLATGADPVPQAMRPALQSAKVLRVPIATLSAWLPAASGSGLQEHLYLVDPMGHLMMRFPARLDMQTAGKAKKDIERLLRASSSWDLPGR